MTHNFEYTAIITREENGYTSLCPELDIASQGSTVEEARTYLIEAIELFLATADLTEIIRRSSEEILVTRIQVSV